MSTEGQIVYVHSVAEAYLYVSVTPCPVCGKGPRRAAGGLTKNSSAPGGWTLAVKCSECRRETVLPFCVNPPPTREQANSPEINPTPQKSSAIDLLGWLTLFETIIEASSKEGRKRSARELAYEAALCLDEAMKFYEGENETPGEEAFFHEASLRRFRDHPEHFARSTWRQRRLMLPDMNIKTRPAAGSRRWWKFWRPSSGR